MNRIANRMTVAVLAFLAIASCSKRSESQQPAAAPTAAASGNRIDITVTEKGFQPEKVSVHKGEPVTLVFTRKTDKTCAKDVILQVDEGNRIEKQLPLDRPVEVAVTFPKAGELQYACGMNMITGVISVE
jgi:plastocyanin domain-containing protein